MAQAPTIAERYAALEASGQPGQATVVSERRLANNQVEQLFSRSGVAPYAVHMSLEGMNGMHEVAVEKATSGIIATAPYQFGMDVLGAEADDLVLLSAFK